MNRSRPLLAVRIDHGLERRYTPGLTLLDIAKSLATWTTHVVFATDREGWPEAQHIGSSVPIYEMVLERVEEGVLVRGLVPKDCHDLPPISFETEPAEIALEKRERAAPGEAAEDAFNEIVKAIGAPGWEYPGQVVRDVQAVGAAAHALLRVWAGRKNFAPDSADIDALRGAMVDLDVALGGRGE